MIGASLATPPDERRPAMREGPETAPGFILETAASPEIFAQYVDLYRAECRLSDDPADEAREREINARSLFLTVRQGNRCIGGARLTTRLPDDGLFLPMENDDFSLASLFPALVRSGGAFCELSRLVLGPDFRSGALTRLILARLQEIAASEGTRTMFAAAPSGNVRLYRRLAGGLGLRQSHIHDEIDVPPYPPGSPVRDVLLRIELAP